MVLMSTHPRIYHRKLTVFLSVMVLLSIAAPVTAQSIREKGDHGGTLTLGKVEVGSLVFHPLYISLSVEHEIANLIYGHGLLRQDRNGLPVDGLGSLPTQYAGGREWVFQLHQGIQFHDGTALTADDIIFTYDLYKRSRNYDPIFHRYFRNLAEIHKIDDWTVSFEMKEPVSVFPTVLATLPILPKYQFERRPFADAAYAPMLPQSIGLGPFKVEIGRARDTIELRANDKWQYDRPYLDRMVYKFYATSEELLAAFVMREVDMVEVEWVSSFQELKRARPDAKIQPIRPRNRAFESIFYNHNRPMLANPLVRRAFTHAIDRVRILARVMMPGTGRVAHSPVDEGFWAHGGATRLKYDPAKALELLHRAGWYDTDHDGVLNQDKHKLRFELLFPRGSITAEKVVRLIKLNLNDIGVDVRPTPVDLKVLVERLRVGAYDAAVFTQQFKPAADDFYALFHSESITPGFNVMNYRNRQVDRNISFLYGITEAARALPIFQQLQFLLSQDQPCTFLYFIERQYIAYDPRFQNVGKSGEFLNPPSSWYILTNPR